MASWPTQNSKSQPLNHPSKKGDFRDKISYKNPCSSFVNLTFGRIVKKLSNFEGIS